MPELRIGVKGLDEAGKSLRKFAEALDLSPFWQLLGKELADTAQERWPLRRRTGKLRRSLTWRGKGLGRGGVFQARPGQLTFGTNVFYSRFFQHGTRHHRQRTLIHVDQEAHAESLQTWLRARAEQSGLEIQ